MRIRIGSIIEIKHKEGYSYAIYTHKTVSDGDLIVIFNKTFDNSITDTKVLLNIEPMFPHLIVIPLSKIIANNLWKIVGIHSVPNNLSEFPIFKWPSLKKDNWWLWDGTKEWEIGILNEVQNQYPIRCTNNPAMVEDYITGKKNYYESPWN